MPRKSIGIYPSNWKEIAIRVKASVNWCCVRCGHPHDPTSGYMLTVHHLSLDKSDCRWFNLVALCQKCHLQIQHKVILERPWLYDHSEWFRPYVGGWAAWHYLGLDLSREEVEANLEYYANLQRNMLMPAQREGMA